MEYFSKPFSPHVSQTFSNPSPYVCDSKVKSQKGKKPSHTCMCHRFVGDTFCTGNAFATAQAQAIIIIIIKLRVAMKILGYSIKSMKFMWKYILYRHVDTCWYIYDTNTIIPSELCIWFTCLSFFPLPFSIRLLSVVSVCIIYSNVFSHLLGMYGDDMWKSFRKAKITWIDDWIEIAIERYVCTWCKLHKDHWNNHFAM